MTPSRHLEWTRGVRCRFGRGPVAAWTWRAASTFSGQRVGERRRGERATATATWRDGTTADAVAGCGMIRDVGCGVVACACGRIAGVSQENKSWLWLLQLRVHVAYRCALCPVPLVAWEKVLPSVSAQRRAGKIRHVASIAKPACTTCRSKCYQLCVCSSICVTSCASPRSAGASAMATVGWRR
jgi:hypothetical protein